VLLVAEAGLGVAVCAAVLAFGGAAPPFFLIPQLVVLILGFLILAASLRSPLTSVGSPLAVPLVLIGLVLLQIMPLPESLASAAGVPGDGMPNRALLTLSVAKYQTVSHLLLLVTYLTAFYLVLLVCQNQDAKKRLVYLLVGLGVFEAFYGLLQYLTGWQQIFAYVKKYYLQDATGTYINRNHFAGLLEMVLPFAVAFALHRARTLYGVALRGGANARVFLSRVELFPLLLWLFLATIILTALVFSRSRMGFVSALASLIAVLAVAGASSFSARVRALVSVIFLLSVVAFVVWIGSDPVVARFETLGQEYSQSRESRISIWRDTLQLIRRHPLLGTGLGTFSVAYPAVQTTFLSLRVDHAHCDYLEAVSELGLPGGILLFGSIFWVLAKSVRQYRRAEGRLDTAVCLGCVGSIAAILVHSLADFNLCIPANALVFTVVLALSWSTAHEGEKPESVPSKVPEM
jgi:O-antigen ligase